ncbi:MAG: hypothetical protein O3A63_17195, partial [Proteobacteria bacterium]|nr:hypothetical protein [Pseudomonadota bacterium]
VGVEVLTHLVNAWGGVVDRSFKRVPTTGTMKVCVGMRAIHYFLSGAMGFVDQLTTSEGLVRSEVNPFLPEPEARGENRDIWDRIYDLEKDRGRASSAGPPERASEQYIIHDTQVLDTSPGGYRMRWSGALAAGLQTGELLAIRDENDARWCLALARWVSQDAHQATMGVALLAPWVVPVAIRVIKKKGGPTDFARALLLPELKAIDQPATLITPTVPFQVNQKIHIQRQGIQSTAQLVTNVLSTKSVKQFTFRMLDGYLENAQIDINIINLSEDDID